MAEADQGRVGCPGCGKTYRWKAELAGRKVRCKCGQVMRMPADAPGAALDDSDGYDLASPEESAAAAPTASRCPSCGQDIKPGTVVCINCGYNLQTGAKIQTAVATDADGSNAPAESPEAQAQLERSEHDEHEEEMLYKEATRKNLHIPLALVVVGVGINFTRLLQDNSFLESSMAIGIELILTVPLMLMSLIVAAKLFDIAYGELGPAILKLVAIAFAPGAFVQLLMMFTGGGIVMLIVGLLLSVVLYWWLISWLFGLDANETVLTVLTIALARNLLFTLIMGWIGVFL